MTDNKKLRVRDYIGHIIEAITRIDSYVTGLERAEFIENSMVHDAVIRNFEIIGEAANNIKTVDGVFTEQNRHLRLDHAYKMRNALAHVYYSVNLLTVWNTIQNDLPVLKKQMIEIQQSDADPSAIPLPIPD